MRREGFFPLYPYEKGILRKLYDEIYGEEGYEIFNHSLETMNRFEAWKLIKKLKKIKDKKND